MVFYFFVPSYSLPWSQLSLILCVLLGAGARDGVKGMQEVENSVSQDLNVWIMQHGYFPRSFCLSHELSLMNFFSKVAVEGLQTR